MLPKGYRVVEERSGSIIVGMFDFLLMFKDAEKFINYNNKTYTRGGLEVIPRELIGHCCSCREYLPFKRAE